MKTNDLLLFAFNFLLQKFFINFLFVLKKVVFLRPEKGTGCSAGR